MKKLNVISLKLTLLVLLSASYSHAGNLKNDFALFLTWFPGEYDNHHQVWQQGEDKVAEEERLEHIHHVFAQVEAPNIGKHLYFVKQYTDGDPNKVYRQRLYHFERNKREKAIQLTIYSFLDEAKYSNGHEKPELMKSLSKENVRTVAGCEVFWKFNGEYFEGYMKEKTCNFFSKRSGKRIFITDDLRLTDSEIWIRDVAHDEDGNWVFGNKAGLYHKNVKVRYFSGWAAIKKAGINAKPEDDQWHSISNIRIHDQGQIFPLRDSDGNKLGYSIQIVQLTYQNTKTAILKLGFIDDKTGKTIAYSWAEPDSKRIGMNLKWLQAGLTFK